MESVDVLQGIDSRDYTIGILAREGKLDEDAVDVPTRVECLDIFDEVLLWSV